MIPVGQPYRPAGRLDVQAILVTVILGFFTAALAAIPIWLWEISPIPTLVIITAIVQGLIVGWCLKYMVGRLKLRSPRLVGTIALGCGLLSVFFVHYAHYIRFTGQVVDQVRLDIQNHATLTPEQKTTALGVLDKEPNAWVNQILAANTGQKGLLGFLMMRCEEGIFIKGHKVTGWVLWLLWAGEAGFVAIAACSMASGRAAAPFCEDCGYWCVDEPDLIILPSPAAEPLSQALQGDNPSAVEETRRHPPEPTSDARAVVSLSACPSCDQAFAKLSSHVTNGDKAVVTVLLNQLRISPEMATAVRFEPPELPEPIAAEADPGTAPENETELEEA